jgi:hypothetical protein
MQQYVCDIVLPRTTANSFSAMLALAAIFALHFFLTPYGTYLKTGDASVFCWHMHCGGLAPQPTVSTTAHRVTINNSSSELVRVERVYTSDKVDLVLDSFNIYPSGLKDADFRDLPNYPLRFRVISLGSGETLLDRIVGKNDFREMILSGGVKNVVGIEVK